MISKTFTVACFLKTITAANTTKMIVETIGGILNAFSKEVETELLITLLTQSQQRSPDKANRVAIIL